MSKAEKWTVAVSWSVSDANMGWADPVVKCTWSETVPPGADPIQYIAQRMADELVRKNKDELILDDYRNQGQEVTADE